MRLNPNWPTSAALAICLGMGLAACEVAPPPEEPVINTSSSSGAGTSSSATASATQTEKPVGIAINLADDSVLKFDGDAASAQLVANMHDGKMPKSCTVLYDQMGSLPAVTVSDGRTMRKVYSLLARMHVTGETDMSVTDSYHSVSFELQDGTKASYSFEGEGILVRGRQGFSVADDGRLWAYVREIQNRYLREQEAGDDWLAITLEDDEELVEYCPGSAPAGEVIGLAVPVVEDANLHVSVNGDEDFGRFVSADSYEFTMPDKPVVVRVWTSADGLPGA